MWVGHFGGKIPFEVWEATFANLLPKQMDSSTSFDMGLMCPDPFHLCLFGLEGGRATLDIFGFQLQAFIHPLFPGMFEPEGSGALWKSKQLVQLAQKLGRW